MDGGFALGEQPGPEHAVDAGVVLGELGQVSLPEQVCAGIAHVGQAEPVVLGQEDRDGRPHPGFVRAFPGPLEDGPVGRQHPLRERGRMAVPCLDELAEGAYGEVRGDLAGGAAAHPIRHGVQRGAHQVGVLVVLANPPTSVVAPAWILNPCGFSVVPAGQGKEGVGSRGGPAAAGPEGPILDWLILDWLYGAPIQCGVTGVTHRPRTSGVRDRIVAEVTPGTGPRWRVPLRIGVPILFSVVAVVVILARSGGGGQSTATRPLPPTDPKVQATSFSVTLTWRQPRGATDAVGWRVFRNHLLLATVDRTTYVDRAVHPGQHYTYEIAAVGGSHSVSRPVAVAATTPEPPLSEARVEGRYRVHYQVLSSRGYSAGYTGATFDQTYVFTPRCPSGPCDLDWQDQQQKKVAPSVFIRDGALYTTRTSGDFSVTCHGMPVTSSLSYSLRVTRASLRGGRWVATELVGTMEESEPATGTCDESGATDSIVVTLPSA
jgi:hypothetical protein